MPRRSIWSARQHAPLFDLPTDEAAVLRHYTLSDRQQRELCRIQATGEYSISDLAELFSVLRPTVFRTLNRRRPP